MERKDETRVKGFDLPPGAGRGTDDKGLDALALGLVAGDEGDCRGGHFVDCCFVCVGVAICKVEAALGTR